MGHGTTDYGCNIPRDIKTVAWMIQNKKHEFMTMNDDGFWVWVISQHDGLQFTRKQDAERIAHNFAGPWPIIPLERHGNQFMKKGTRVSWLAEGATVRGTGITISDEEGGRVLVAVDKGVFENIPMAYHMVIHCTVTWLIVAP